MLETIFHQVFWGLFSFSLFFFLTKHLVIANIIKVENKRSVYIEKITEQINSMQEKSQLLNNIAAKIINEEIPEKQKLYIEKNLEPVLSEIKMEQLNHRQKLMRLKIKNYQHLALASAHYQRYKRHAYHLNQLQQTSVLQLEF